MFFREHFRMTLYDGDDCKDCDPAQMHGSRARVHPGAMLWVSSQG